MQIAEWCSGWTTDHLMMLLGIGPEEMNHFFFFFLDLATKWWSEVESRQDSSGVTTIRSNQNEKPRRWGIYWLLRWSHPGENGGSHLSTLSQHQPAHWLPETVKDCCEENCSWAREWDFAKKKKLRLSHPRKRCFINFRRGSRAIGWWLEVVAVWACLGTPAYICVSFAWGHFLADLSTEHLHFKKVKLPLKFQM